MQPKTIKKYTSQILASLQRKLAITKACHEGRRIDPEFALETPVEVGLKLTNRCNLRCTHCFQWNEVGYHRNFPEAELNKIGDLDLAVIRKILTDTESTHAKLYIWGGEPMAYSAWADFAKLLAHYDREVVVCTNGLYIKKHVETILPMSQEFTMLISVEGLEAQHDKLRGKGTFKATIDNIQFLLDLKRLGQFKGNISVAGVVSDDLIPSLYDFCRYFEDLEIETLFINYPWFIPTAVSGSMDQYFQNKFSWLSEKPDKRHSWHSFDFHINEQMTTDLLNQLDKIRSRAWNIRIRIQPDMDDADLRSFIKGTTQSPKRTTCLSISNRIDVMANGDVVPCKKFPEFKVGNINNNSVHDIWHGEKFKQFRKVHNNELMPICSKCELLYSNGI